MQCSSISQNLNAHEKQGEQTDVFARVFVFKIRPLVLILLKEREYVAFPFETLLILKNPL